jgi:hypothetical protein
MCGWFLYLYNIYRDIQIITKWLEIVLCEEREIVGIV